MRLSLVGVDHQTAPVAVREKVSISADKLGDALSSLREHVPHGVILSTCNRTEVYSAGGGVGAENAALDFLKKRLNVMQANLPEYLYVAHGKQAAAHLFNVASGLESMVVGEHEVLGQVRQALDAAEAAGTVNLPLRQLFQSAIRAGRRVREETGISKNALSTSSVAVELAARAVGDLNKCRMLVIGAGEAGRLVARVARERGTSQIIIANRTRDRAQELAEELGGIPIGIEGVPGEMEKAAIVVTCAAAPHRILEVQHVQAAMAKRPELPLVIIDIALPRNVAPEAGEIKNVFLYNIDALTEVSDTNRKRREGEMHGAGEIVAEELEKFVSWSRDYEVRPMVRALMGRAEEIRSTQFDKTLKKLRPLSGEERESLQAMTESIVTKILKGPVQFLKTNGNGAYSDLVRDMFQLEDEKEK